MSKAGIILLLIAVAGASPTKLATIDGQEFSCRPSNESQSILSLGVWRIDEELIATSSCEMLADSTSKEWFASAQLTGEGAEKLFDFSRQNLQKEITIKINGVKHGAPIVQTPLTSGVIRIMDNFEQEEACQIARTILKLCP